MPIKTRWIPSITLTACVGLTLSSIAAFAEPPDFTISTVVGIRKAGFSGDGGPALEAQVNRPSAVALDSAGNLYIGDFQNNRVRRVDPSGTISTVIGTGETDPNDGVRPGVETNLHSPYGVAVDGADNVYVTSRSHHIVYKMGPDGMAVPFAGNGTKGFSGDDGLAIEAQISNPNHMVADTAGNVFLVDSGNRRIRKIDTNGVIATIAGTGEAGFSGDGGPAIDATMAGGSAIAIDAAGNLYLADFSNHRIRKISTDGIITTIAGTGEKKFNGDGLPAIESNFGEPTGVAVDFEGNVYIADQVNHRVRVVTPDGLMHTVAGIGKVGYTGDGGPATEARIFIPDIICVDPAGNVYIPEFQNHVVRKLTRN